MKGHFAVRHNSQVLPNRGTQVSESLSLPPELQAQAQNRLSWLALIYAGTFFLAFFPGWITYVVLGRSLNLNFFVAVTSIMIALLLFVVARKGWLTHSGLLAAGLCFEVLGALGISLSELGGFFEYTAGKHVFGIGISWICVWITFFPLVLPSRPRIALMTALFAASMGPLAFFLIWINSGQPPLPQGVLTIHIVLAALPAYVCAAMAYVGARIIYQLGTEVTKERELGSYQLDSRIGQGGMGEVWRARHRMLIRPAAIKLIRPDRISSAEEGSASTEKRFEREAQATAALHSPHTVELWDYGVTQDGTLYYVMELLDGLDLDSFVNRFGPVPWDRAIYLLRQVCHSLHEAHECGLIHRDIKPANVFICRNGFDYDFVKVLDFGLVRRDGKTLEDETRLTSDGFVGGTPAFLPPEMALGKGEIDGRTDIYAVGCLSYWLVAGALVFEGSTPMELAMKHVHEAPVPPSKKTEMDIPEQLEQTILKCLEKDPAKRPQSASELDQLLEESVNNSSWGQAAAAKWWMSHMPNAEARSDLFTRDTE
jgi:serine/threonine-protein kinase